MGQAKLVEHLKTRITRMGQAKACCYISTYHMYYSDWAS